MNLTAEINAAEQSARILTGPEIHPDSFDMEHGKKTTKLLFLCLHLISCFSVLMQRCVHNLAEEKEMFVMLLTIIKSFMAA